MRTGMASCSLRRRARIPLYSWWGRPQRSTNRRILFETNLLCARFGGFVRSPVWLQLCTSCCFQLGFLVFSAFSLIRLIRWRACFWEPKGTDKVGFRFVFFGFRFESDTDGSSIPKISFHGRLSPYLFLPPSFILPPSFPSPL